MLIGATGQAITMALLAILGAVNNNGAKIASAVLLFVFNTFFGIGWLGMTWLYVGLSFLYEFPWIINLTYDQPAEIVGLRMRGPANALSTASNWTFNFLVVMITGPAFENIGYKTYISMSLSLCIYT
jgi:hypothetical protein